MKLFSVLQLIRPANIITAVADIMAGIAIAGFFIPDLWNQHIVMQVILLIISTICLYAGGIIFNDVFDIESDRLNRPERVIPSGRISLKEATFLGIIFFVIGVLSAFTVSFFSGAIAVVVMLCALVYDKYAKHQKILGPLCMGICRGGNLILGMSININLEPKFWLIGIVPIIFIAAITLTAQKETKGKNKRSILIAMFLDILVVVSFVLMNFYLGLSLFNSAIFILVWYGVNVVAKLKAILNNKPEYIMKAVKLGILSLIPLNASYTAGFSNVYMAVFVMCLLPLSIYLSKKFPVT